MEEYGFNPNFILKSLISVYASFVDYKEFLSYVVKDQRSYKIANFEKVLRIANRGKTNFNFEDLDKFENMIDKLKELDNINKANEVLITYNNQISYDDAPDDFLDPITTDLMEDPVLLPSSKQIVDRNTIGNYLS